MDQAEYDVTLRVVLLEQILALLPGATTDHLREVLKLLGEPETQRLRALASDLLGGKVKP